MRGRRLLRRVHLWLALAAGGLFVVTSVTGGLLVFGREIDRRLNPGLFRASGGADVGFDAAASAVGEVFPGRRIATLWSPRAKQGVYEAVLAGEPPTVVYVDPGSGRVLGSRVPGETLVGFVRELHVSLLAGPPGERVVGAGGVLLLATLLTGLLLWMPRRPALGFRVRLRKGRFAALYDSHKLVGVVTLPLLGLAAATGALLTFHAFGKAAVHTLTLSEPLAFPAPASLRCEPTGAGRLSPEAWRRVAESAIPGAKVSFLAFPATETGVVQARLRRPGSPHPNGAGRVWLDPYTARVLFRHDPETFNTGSRLYAEWAYPLHIGTYAGAPSRVVQAAVSLAPLFLVGTGVALWPRRHGADRGRPGRRERATRTTFPSSSRPR